MRTRSCEVLAEGGLPFNDMHKANSLGVVSVQTDDAEIAVGHLMSEGRSEIRVLIGVQKRMFDRFQFGGAPKFQIVRIPRRRIRTLRKRSA
jgi:hypothetical protein